MRTAQVANLQGVLFDEIVTIVRGTTTFSISKYELDDLITVLRRLSSGMGGELPERPVELSEEPVDFGSTDRGDLEQRSQIGRVWYEVRRYLQSCQRAQGLNSIVRHVKRARVVDGDPSDAVEQVLKQRMDERDVVETRSGRYTLNRRR